MAGFLAQNPWVLTFGLLGNMISFLVYLAPVPTFVRVVKKKSTEGFQSYPYMVSLISAMIWIYYASLKSNEYLLITINSFGCVTETIYIAIFIAYAPKQVKMPTLRLVILLNFGGFCLILLVSHYFLKGAKRLEVLGWLCDAFAVGVFAAPLSIMRVVIRTKSVEFMPVYLSLFLTVSAIAWLLYGILSKDFYIAGPNVIGVILGAAQIVVYVIYKKCETVIEEPNKVPEFSVDIVKLSKITASEAELLIEYSSQLIIVIYLMFVLFKYAYAKVDRTHATGWIPQGPMYGGYSNQGQRKKLTFLVKLVMAFHITWAFSFGILGNLVSVLVSLAPLATFYQIYRRKSSEGFQSIPYVIGMFSAMLWLFYAIFKKDATLLITINIFTFCMQTGYIIVYFLYATKKDRILTTKLVLLFDVFGFGVICLLSLFLTKGEKRIAVLGWICMIFALCVFVAPLGIMKKVIQTKSVEFMPFYLSFFLTLSAVMWFFYGFLMKDLFVAVPNTLGFLFGVAQMSLYAVYKNYKKKLPAVAEVLEPQLQELSEHIVDVVKLSAMVCPHELISAVMVNINMGTEKVEVENERGEWTCTLLFQGTRITVTTQKKQKPSYPPS
ncbi:uncharacterized protein LOC120004207 [Tripterygium wilfordii]|uniref:uncharacterized protein LOC120004207 n=1 Tax=Tripterygium wilfordii TaxID=458696 RepID=UPI0018F7F8CA|nr:uncharacterized protein LOC120004207 [Tripterygium wilfordii]